MYYTRELELGAVENKVRMDECTRCGIVTGPTGQKHMNAECSPQWLSSREIPFPEAWTADILPESINKLPEFVSIPILPVAFRKGQAWSVLSRTRRSRRDTPKEYQRHLRYRWTLWLCLRSASLKHKLLRERGGATATE